MFNISLNGIVTVNRGDSFYLPITLNIGDSINRNIYTLQEGDILYLGVMEPNQPFETAIVRKKVTYQDIEDNGSINVRFWPEDTMYLTPGKYYYQVKIETVDLATNRKDIETVVDKTLFYIQE